MLQCSAEAVRADQCWQEVLWGTPFLHIVVSCQIIIVLSVYCSTSYKLENAWYHSEVDGVFFSRSFWDAASLEKISFSLSINCIEFDMVSTKYQSKMFFWLHCAPFENVPVTNIICKLSFQRRRIPFSGLKYCLSVYYIIDVCVLREEDTPVINQTVVPQEDPFLLQYWWAKIWDQVICIHFCVQLLTFEGIMVICFFWLI